MTSSTAPEAFRRAVATMDAVRPRPEVVLGPIKAPQRLAPWAHAVSAEIGGDSDGDDAELASGRLVLLHDPDGQDMWHGTFRVVIYARAEMEGELVGDPLLPAVGWSWLTEALQNTGARYTALGGTVTQTSSARFGDIAGPQRSDDIELRASWTPRDEDLTAHGEAFCELLAIAAGLPPVGVAPLTRSAAPRPPNQSNQR